MTMKKNILLAGVGGQGVLSAAAIIARAAVKAGLMMRQSEVHGMAQRGGSVVAHLRIASADSTIAGDLIPYGACDLLIAMEPLESLRYVQYAAPSATLITACAPVCNIAEYPDLARILGAVQRFPHAYLIEADRLAKEAGNAKAINVVMAGSASAFLPIPDELMEQTIAELFGGKDAGARESNKKAFALGKAAVS